MGSSKKKQNNAGKPTNSSIQFNKVMQALSSKKEKLVTIGEDKNEYASKLNTDRKVSLPMMKMLFDFFNILNDKKEVAAKHNIEILGFLNENGRFLDNLPENVSGIYSLQVFIKYNKELHISMLLERFKQDGEMHNIITLNSKEFTMLSSEDFVEKIINASIEISNLKGSYIYLPPKTMFWDIKELEPRGYDDIFLPEQTMRDIKFYDELQEKKGIGMRYILAGAPGTAKTETTLVLANQLKARGVTIIKTQVCEFLKEKFELAEILSPSIVILDDLDLSLGSRKAGFISGGLGMFLDVMDGTDKMSKSIGVIATTNSIHLLDIAAQRPGRFDKILSFDSITKDNIRGIILKSLYRNFNIEKDDVAKLFTSKKIIDIFYDLKTTGSYVYHATQMIYEQCDTLNQELTEEYILSYIKEEVANLEKVRKYDYLTDKMSGESAKMSFDFDSDDSEIYYGNESPAIETGFQRRRKS